MSKYGAVRTQVGDVWFASKGEAGRYSELLLLLAAGQIKDLTLQTKYYLVVNNINIGTYIADFVYIENGEIVVEDFKGVRTPVYRLKAKLMWALYRIKIFETGR